MLCVAYCRRSARELKRHHAILEGAVFARFSEALMGTACIRAYGREQQFVSVVHRALDDMDSAYFLTFASQRWLSVRLDNIGGLLTFATGVLVVTNRLSVSPSIAGLILSYSLSVAGIIQITVKYLAEVDNSMCSTERLYQYTSSLAQEAPLECEPRMRQSWPERGEIVYEAVQMRYRPELPLVIDNFSLQIHAGERIGIVGRTGAGKSTILSTLFRLTELAGGRILVDGVDISRIGLQELRSQLAIIPQDPTLFKGTIRSNIDPFNKHTDLELWDALRQAHLSRPPLPARSARRRHLRRRPEPLPRPTPAPGLGPGPPALDPHRAGRRGHEQRRSGDGRAHPGYSGARPARQDTHCHCPPPAYCAAVRSPVCDGARADCGVGEPGGAEGTGGRRVQGHV